MYLLVTNPEKVQLIHPPMRIMGSTFVTLPFIMSVSMLGSVGCYNHIVKHMSAKKKKGRGQSPGNTSVYNTNVNGLFLVTVL